MNEERITRTYRMTPAEQQNLDEMVILLRSRGVPASRSDLARIGVALLNDMVHQALMRAALPADVPVDSLEAWARNRIRNLIFPEQMGGQQPSAGNGTVPSPEPLPASPATGDESRRRATNSPHLPVDA